MKKITLVVLASTLVLSGAALAQQSGEQKNRSSMHDMMQQMMKGEKSGESGMGGMGGMGSMGGMMGMKEQMPKMMEQCAAMMGSAGTETQKAK